MSGSPRQKARDLIAAALNNGAEGNEMERASWAIQAVRIIDKYNLLGDPKSDGKKPWFNEDTITATKTVVSALGDMITDPKLAAAASTLMGVTSFMRSAVKPARAPRVVRETGTRKKKRRAR